MTPPVSLAVLDGGACWRVTLGGSKGNILDQAMMSALTRVFLDARHAAPLKAVVLEGAGGHFSFGASVQEHLPDQVDGMMRCFHELLFAVLDSSIVVLASVSGQCLGGGLELVSLAHRVFAHRDARFGQPEISLGVFAPAASVLLPMRLRRTHAEDLCLTGRSVAAPEALALGLIDELVDDPSGAALAWARAHLASKSASSLRLAVRAVRGDLAVRLKTHLPAVERLYLDELMKTADAVEGLQAFLDKRPPRWSTP